MPRFPIIPQLGRKVIEYPLDGAAAYKNGALVVLDGDEEVVECGADPATVLGIGIHDAAGRDVFPDKALVAVAHSGATFLATGDNDPVQDDIGKEYGAAKDGDDIWYVDGTDAVNTVFKVVNIDTLRNLYEVSVLPGVRAMDV